jgi:dipeptidase E
VKKRQIIAMGGGGFSSTPDDRRLDRYVLESTGLERPKICFIPTASGDALHYIERFYNTFGTLACTPAHLALFDPPCADLRSFIFEHDAVYVGGGNTKNMLALWREWSLDGILREAYDSGIVLSGLSAGSICWFDAGVTDSIPGPLTPLQCLGFLSGSNCPHYDVELERRPAFHRLVTEGALPAGIATDDGVALHYVEESLHKIVSATPTGAAYSVAPSLNGAVETPLPVHRLP